MVVIGIMKTPRWTRLIDFLQREMALPTAAIDFGLKHCDEQVNLLPVVLWQYGLVSLEQLDRIFDWLEASQP
ncbi:MAG: DUF2949 domain-containing protein [Cyanobacteria bacterium J003]|nr:MAG: DUF2949 domain-containing protein [Cyanobacteria bacterium J003]